MCTSKKMLKCTTSHQCMYVRSDSRTLPAVLRLAPLPPGVDFENYTTSSIIDPGLVPFPGGSFRRDAMYYSECTLTRSDKMDDGARDACGLESPVEKRALKNMSAHLLWGLVVEKLLHHRHLVVLCAGRYQPRLSSKSRRREELLKLEDEPVLLAVVCVRRLRHRVV